MTTPPRSKNQSEHEPPPGADRFWGQFSQAGKKKGAEPEDEPANESQAASGEPSEHGHECLEWCPICRSAEILRHAATPEAAQQILTLQKEAATVLKAFVVAYSDKIDDFAGKPAAPADPTANASAGNNANRPDADAGPRITDIRID